MSYKITITQINQSDALIENVVFVQAFEDLNLSQVIRDLNRVRRARKAKAQKIAPQS